MFRLRVLFKFPQQIAFNQRKMSGICNKAYVNGEWLDSKNTFQVLNPANGEVIGSVPDMDVADVQKAIDAAHNAFETWQTTTGKERSILLRKWYSIMVENCKEIASVMTKESGKPITESNGEVLYGNSFVEWFSEEARRINGEVISSPHPNREILLLKQPIGVAGLITPWNFPHAMITRKAAAAIAAGCTCVVKPAEDTPLTALLLAKYAELAGFPKGIFNVITSSRKNAASIGKLFCESPQIAGISFTGSTQVGKLLYEQCAGTMKRLGLELGGNAPFIVFESANLDQAIPGALTSKFRNCGQACVAANRFFIHQSLFDTFLTKFVDSVMNFVKMGDGNDPSVTIGPLINEAQMTKVENLVSDAREKGAKILLGGKKSPLGKLYYEPTVITGVTENMLIYNEEVFGPIATFIPFSSEEEVLKIANSTRRGLAGYFYSQDLSQVFRVAKKLEAGMVGVNEGLISTCEAAFGGIKESGLGREGSHHGIDDYTFIKYVCLGNLN